jgi:hypothetical protein
MAFRIKDLIVTVLPKGSPEPLGECEVSERCDLAPDTGGGPGPGDGGPGPGDGGPGPGGGGPGPGDGGGGCPFPGCSRIQCSKYPTNDLRQAAMADVAAAELALLKTQLKVALLGIEAQEQAVQQLPVPVHRPKTVQDIDVLKERLQEALQELSTERAQLEKSMKSSEAGPSAQSRRSRKKP